METNFYNLSKLKGISHFQQEMVFLFLQAYGELEDSLGDILYHTKLDSDHVLIISSGTLSLEKDIKIYQEDCVNYSFFTKHTASGGNMKKSWDNIDQDSVHFILRGFFS